jgi:hypothetical protein
LIALDNPPESEILRWLPSIKVKDAPILAVAVFAQVDRLLTLNAEDFTEQVAGVSGVRIQAPREFVNEIRTLYFALNEKRSWLLDQPVGKKSAFHRNRSVVTENLL